MLFVTLKSNIIVAIVSHVDYYPNFESQFSSNPLVWRKEKYTVFSQKIMLSFLTIVGFYVDSIS